MNNFSSFLLLLLVSIFFSSCGSSLKNTPIKTINDQTEGLHKTIEETASKAHLLEDYQSLSFGQMKVFKPDAFIRLDSVYNVKQEYLSKNDLRGLKRSGIEDLIPGYRAEALQEIDKVQYEIEHIYQTSTADSIHIYNSFFLFDYKDSLLLVSPFYNFKLAKKHQNFFYAFQFDYHFISDRDLYISEKEWEFIRHFKGRQIELIGTEELAPFMNHTMHIMEMARKVATVDFRNISRQVALNYFKDLGKKITIDKVAQLMTLENNDMILGYELEIEWLDETNETSRNNTVFKFSPYLEIQSILTKKIVRE